MGDNNGTMGSREQRGDRRVAAKVPATVKAGARTISAETRDISSGGIFLYADESFAPGSEIHIVLMLPRELGMAEDQLVCCHARVVRNEGPAADGRQGIAAVVERFAMAQQV
jgi:c-di-GMP-binding flagellar brake protein YcgR